MSSVAGWEFLTRQGVSEMCMFCFVVHIVEPWGEKQTIMKSRWGKQRRKVENGGTFLNPRF